MRTLDDALAHAEEVRAGLAAGAVTFGYDSMVDLVALVDEVKRLTAIIQELLHGDHDLRPSGHTDAPIPYAKTKFKEE